MRTSRPPTKHRGALYARAGRLASLAAVTTLACSSGDPTSTPPANKGSTLVDCPLDPRGAAPRPLWSEQPTRVVPEPGGTSPSHWGTIVACDPKNLGKYPTPEGGNANAKGADLQNVSTNFHILSTVKLLASAMTKATAKIEEFTTDADKADSQGSCVCADPTAAGCLPATGVTRAECNTQCDAGSCGGVSVWAPNDVFTDKNARVRTALELVGLLDESTEFLEDVNKALKTVNSGLANTTEILEKLQCYVDLFTEGYHLGGYSDQRPDLHACVGYFGHGAYANIGSNGKFDIGGRYTSHNLSKDHRAQFRTGGFGITAFGRNISVLPGIEFDTQIDGYKPFNACAPLGIKQLGGGPPGACPNANLPTIWVGDGNAPAGSVSWKNIDIFHLLEQKDLKKISGDDYLSAGELLVANFMPFQYGNGTYWPRDNVQQPWEGSSAAVFSAGLNINPHIKPIEKFLPQIPIFTGVTLTPVIRLKAGADWKHEAYSLRKRLQDAINKHLPDAEKLDTATFDRDMHALQGPDVTADNGVGIYVNPEVDMRLDIGLAVGGRLTIGIAASLGLGVNLKPGASGGLVDLSRGLDDALNNSNPGDGPCSPTLKTTRSTFCSDKVHDTKDKAYDATAGRSDGSDPQKTYACTADDAPRSCCLTLNGTAGGVERVCLDGFTGIDKAKCECNGSFGDCLNTWAPYMSPNTLVDLTKRKDDFSSFTKKWSADKTCKQCRENGTCDAPADGIAASATSECGKHGRCIHLDGTVDYDVTEAECWTVEYTFLPYTCMDKITTEHTGWEGPGCHPLNSGFTSACGCSSDGDCASGESCDKTAKRCTSGGSAMSCACDGGGCPAGRTCSNGACIVSCGGGASCSSEYLTCDAAAGGCVLKNNVPFAEQVVYQAHQVPSPAHAVSTYAMTDIELLAYYNAAIKVGASLRLFGKKWEYILWQWAKSFDLGSTQKAKYQPGLSATYQEGCDASNGTVKNHQPGAAAGASCSGKNNLVCRYPNESSPNWASFDQPDELIAACKGKMPNDVENPPVPTSEDFANNMLDVVNFGQDIGVDMWNQQQLCVGGGRKLIDFLADKTSFEDCIYQGRTSVNQATFKCSEMQHYLPEVWGCLNVEAEANPQILALLRSRLPDRAFDVAVTYGSSLSGGRVLDLDAILNSRGTDIDINNVRVEIRNVLSAGELSFLVDWLRNVEQCYGRHHDIDSTCYCRGDAACNAQAQETCVSGSCQSADGRKAACPFVAIQTSEARACCGDGVKMPSEECDDGNTTSGDGCSWDCRDEKPAAACCLSSGCEELTGNGATSASAACVNAGGRPFPGRSCAELNFCGGGEPTGYCRTSDGQCRSPTTAMACYKAGGVFSTTPCADTDYLPCGGKVACDVCHLCSPADSSCLEPDITHYCDRDKRCVMMRPICDMGRCPTDFNKDGITNDADYAYIQIAYNKECPPTGPCPSDLNRDGITNEQDADLFRPYMNKPCP